MSYFTPEVDPPVYKTQFPISDYSPSVDTLAIDQLRMEVRSLKKEIQEIRELIKRFTDTSYRKEKCDHSFVYKILYDKTTVNICEKCKLVE